MLLFAELHIEHGLQLRELITTLRETLHWEDDEGDLLEAQVDLEGPGGERDGVALDL